jgi:hypothetical protein
MLIRSIHTAKLINGDLDLESHACEDVICRVKLLGARPPEQTVNCCIALSARPSSPVMFMTSAVPSQT